MHSSDDFAIAHDRDFIRDREHFREFVSDDDYRFALLAHATQDRKELLDFQRRQYRGGFVEDQQTRVPVERLQEFDALLLAHRQVFDRFVGIDGELELFGELPDLRRRAFEIEREAASGFSAEHDVLGDCHRLDQHKMLVDHADAESDRVVR